MLRTQILANAVVFLAALATTWLTTPLAGRLAERLNVMAVPNARSVHRRPTPYLGGLAMYLGLVAAFAVAALIPPLAGAVRSGGEAGGVLLAGLVVLVFMTLDDVRDISPPAKIATLVLASSVLVLFGVTLTFFRIPFFDFVVLSSAWAPLIAAVWVIVLCNAMNLVDGLDGLAAGVAGIAALAMFLFAIRLEEQGLLESDSLGPVICAAVAGMSFGFLRWNFFPAKIFMGDAGAMLLGLLLASAVMMVGGRVDDAFSGQTFFFFAPLILPLVVLAIPLADMFFSFGRRILKGQSFATPDRQHLHHRLLEMGHGERRTVVIIYAWTILLSVVVLVPTYTGALNQIVPFALAAIALLIYVVFHPGEGADADVGPARRGKHVRPRDVVEPPSYPRRDGGRRGGDATRSRHGRPVSSV